MLQFMAQNIMVGTVDGDIYYVRNGRVPVRPNGCDPSKPMPGAAARANGRACIRFEDLVQITNPPQGYMQNCNISPFAMMKDSPLVPEEYAAHPYLYNDGRTPPHQRAAMMLDLLDAAHDVTAEQMMAIAFSPQVWHAELWQERIRQAAPEGESGEDAGRLEPPQRRRFARCPGLLPLQDVAGDGAAARWIRRIRSPASNPRRA